MPLYYIWQLSGRESLIVLQLLPLVYTACSGGQAPSIGLSLSSSAVAAVAISACCILLCSGGWRVSREKRLVQPTSG